MNGDKNHLVGKM